MGVVFWLLEILTHNAVAIGAAAALISAVPTGIHETEEAYLKAKEIERVHAEERAKKEVAK